MNYHLMNHLMNEDVIIASYTNKKLVMIVWIRKD